ncbi:MAG: hypothetical protein ACLGRW_10600 [Acidobacteriota bacterium]|jgi:hypothetical protein
MLILRHFLRALFFLGAFLLGSLMVEYTEAFPARPAPSGRIHKLFRFGGRTFQLVSAVGGLLDVVALLLLITGWFSELLLGF